MRGLSQQMSYEVQKLELSAVNRCHSKMRGPDRQFELSAVTNEPMKYWYTVPIM